ncbi:MAG: mechanosensitive ion channel family protein [Bacilli bacterium]|nr:mechanosensitive ion channel family protein [Bacilli bacterium]
MLVGLAAPEANSIIICSCVLVLYFVLMYLKGHAFKNITGKKAIVINVTTNLLFLLGALFLVLYFSGNFNFNTIKENVINTFVNESARIMYSIAVILVSVTIFNTIKIIVGRPIPKITKSAEKRRKTLSKVAISFLRYCVYIIDAIIILAIWGVDIGPMLAGLGIASVVIGLGAQKLINDFISGVFIIFERHFDVGDVIEASGFKGEVIDIGLKTTRIKNWKGEVQIIANGNINELINYSLDISVASVVVQIAYEANIDEAIKLINENLITRMKETEHLITAPKVVGVSELASSGVSLTINATTESECHYSVQREMLKLIKEIFDENGIEIPYQQLVVTNKKVSE